MKMEMLIGSSTRQSRTFSDVAINLAGFRIVAAHSSAHVFKRFAGSAANVAGLGESLKRIAQREFGYDIVLPAPPVGGAEVAAGMHGAPVAVLEERLSRYVERLESSVRGCRYFGRVEHLGRSTVRFSFCEATRQTGLFDHTFTMTRKVHDLVNSSERKLTDWDVVLPRKQERLVGMLPSNVLSHVRVIIGTLVLVDESAAGTERREHAFGRRIREAGEAVRKYGSTAATVALGAVGGVSTGVYAVGTAMALAIADPALVIGDLVISGWLE